LKDADQLKRSVRLGYDQLVAAGRIESDAAQTYLIARLDLLSDHLADTALAVKGSSLGWLFGRSRPKPPSIRGLYVYGSVGRGKTMLMDLFFERAPVKAISTNSWPMRRIGSIGRARRSSPERSQAATRSHPSLPNWRPRRTFSASMNSR
jgi:predicted ATPase